MLAVSLVLARLLVEPNTPAPQLTEDGVLLVQRKDVQLGCSPTGDAGTGDGGVDGGVDGPGDAADAGTDGGIGDGGLGDAGVPDPACEPIFGDAVSLIVRPRFQSDPTGARFALLFVTPGRPIVEAVSDLFSELADLTATKIEVNIIEVPDPALGQECRVGGGCGMAASESAPEFDPPGLGDAGVGDGPPTVETVGPYEIVRVQPAGTAELAALLDSFGYVYQQDDLDALAPYIDRGYTVVAVRVAIDRPTHGSLRPISMTWAGSELRLPAALGSSDTQGMTVYVAGEGRLEFPGASVPFAKYVFGAEALFLTRNDLSSVQAETPDDDPVATLVGYDEFHHTTTVNQEKRVPISDCGISCGGCRDCSVRGNVTGDYGVMLLVIALLLKKRRARSWSTSSRRPRRAAR